jgi:transcription factor MYB, plant
MLLLEDVHRKSSKFGRDESQTLTISQIDAELALMTTMTAEEAAAAADRAVAEAETIMAEAEAAAKEAEAAEADAQAAQALADEALLALKNRNATKLVIALVHGPFVCYAVSHVEPDFIVSFASGRLFLVT